MRQSGKRARDREPFAALALSDAYHAGAEAKQARWWESIPAMLRHPLVLLLVSSALLPLIINQLNNARALTEARQKKAAEFSDKNAAFEGQLYALYAELGLFHQSNKASARAATAALPSDRKGDEPAKLQRSELARRQSEFDKAFTTHYQEFLKFNSEESLWVDDLYAQGLALKLFSAADVGKLRTLKGAEPPPGLPANLLKLREYIELYKQNFIDSVGLLGDFKRELLKDTYAPQEQEVSNRIQDLTAAYNDLREERSLIVAMLASDFTP